VIGTRVAAVRRMLVLLSVSPGQVAFLVGLGVVTAAFEAVGVGLLIPLLSYVEQGPRVFEENRLAATAAWIAAPLGLQPGLPLLLLTAFVPVLGRQLFRFLRQLYANRVRYAAIARLRRDGVGALLEADLAFVVGRGHARLVGTLTTEVERCTNALPYFLSLIESALLIVIYLVMLLLVAAPLVPVVVTAMFLTALAIRAKIRRAKELGQVVADQGSALHVAISERLIGFRLVKLRGCEAAETSHLGQLASSLSTSHSQIVRVKEVLEASVEPIMLAGVFSALYVAIGVLGVGLARIGAFGLIMTRLVPMLQQVNIARLDLAVMIGGLEEIAGQAESARATADLAPSGMPFPGLRKEIVFDSVGFRYGDNPTWALRDVSFTAKKGSLTAIVGRSGAGKSTLLDLVPRLRTVTRGEIRVDGVPLERFDLISLRRAVGFVDQEGFLFDGTIAQNIAYGFPGATSEAIADAARRAHAAEFIERLPDGYASHTGHQGHRLSVGQRQRVCIARVLLQDPDILLLDEPTSALDGESEQYICAVLNEVRTRTAVIVVAHRLTTIRGADQIIVLEGGHVVEFGKHDALLAQLGAYHQLFDLQVHG
jgi:ABC-type multidrug transport system fused ATPase/permease subunit